MLSTLQVRSFRNDILNRDGLIQAYGRIRRSKHVGNTNKKSLKRNKGYQLSEHEIVSIFPLNPNNPIVASVARNLHSSCFATKPDANFLQPLFSGYHQIRLSHGFGNSRHRHTTKEGAGAQLSFVQSLRNSIKQLSSNIGISKGEHVSNTEKGGSNAALLSELRNINSSLKRRNYVSWSARIIKTIILGAAIYYIYEWASTSITISDPTNVITNAATGGDDPAGSKFLWEPSAAPISFADVRGMSEAKEEMAVFVDYLRSPDRFKEIGARMPRGVLLVGPPGNGKTLLARAVAGEAKVPIYYAAGSQFDEVFIGVGSKRVRELFTAAKANSPSIVFIDELDSVGASRRPTTTGGTNQTLNQLLAEMDGFNNTENVLVIAATNLRGDLDKALTRPGRFDMELNIMPPDESGRADILSYYLKKIKASIDVDVDLLAKLTRGLNGADLENLVNQAALRCVALHQNEVDGSHFEYAFDKVSMGQEWKGRKRTQAELESTAYHEGGHALVQLLTKTGAELHKVTIMARGHALGVTHSRSEETYSTSRSELLGQIDAAMGGRVAEELFKGRDEVSTGASSDFEQVTNVALSYVTRFGMSDIVGPRIIDRNDPSFPKEAVNAEVERLTRESYERTKKLLTDNRKHLDNIAKSLLVHHTLTGAQVEKIVHTGKPLPALTNSDGVVIDPAKIVPKKPSKSKIL